MRKRAATLGDKPSLISWRPFCAPPRKSIEETDLNPLERSASGRRAILPNGDETRSTASFSAIDRTAPHIAAAHEGGCISQRRAARYRRRDAIRDPSAD